MSDIELLALITGSVGARAASSVGDELLANFGDLRRLRQADVWELMQLGRLGVASACSLRAAFVLSQRALQPLPDPETRIRGGVDVFERLRARFLGARKETFLAVYLDAKHRFLREERVSEGTLNASIVHPRDVFGPALRMSAAAVVVAHNHPSGDPAPSAEDLAVTHRLAEVSRLVGIPLVDHVVVGDERYYSFLEHGHLPRNGEGSGP